MNKVLLAIAGLTHPVLAPAYSILVYLSWVAGYAFIPLLLFGIWLMFTYWLLPLVYFAKIRSYNLIDPSIPQRRSIYKAYTLVNLGLVVVAYFTLKEYTAFFAGAAALHMILYLLSAIGMKPSWHTATWGFLLLAAMLQWYELQQVNFEITVLLFAVLLIVVFLCRLLQRAHTPLELVVGVAVGVIASQIIYLL